MSGISFASLTRALADTGQSIRFPAHGQSMRPFLRDGDILIVVPMDQVRLGDVVLICTEGDHCLAHRVVRCFREGQRIVSLRTQGDAHLHPDPVVPWSAVVGRVVARERSGRHISLTDGITWWSGLLWTWLAPLRRAMGGAAVRLRRLWRWLLQQGPGTEKGTWGSRTA